MAIDITNINLRKAGENQLPTNAPVLQGQYADYIKQNLGFLCRATFLKEDDMIETAGNVLGIADYRFSDAFEAHSEELKTAEVVQINTLVLDWRDFPILETRKHVLPISFASILFQKEGFHQNIVTAIINGLLIGIKEKILHFLQKRGGEITPLIEYRPLPPAQIQVLDFGAGSDNISSGTNAVSTRKKGNRYQVGFIKKLDEAGLDQALEATQQLLQEGCPDRGIFALLTPKTFRSFLKDIEFLGQPLVHNTSVESDDFSALAIDLHSTVSCAAPKICESTSDGTAKGDATYPEGVTFEIKKIEQSTTKIDAYTVTLQYVDNLEIANPLIASSLRNNVRCVILPKGMPLCTYIPAKGSAYSDTNRFLVLSLTEDVILRVECFKPAAGETFTISIPQSQLSTTIALDELYTHSPWKIVYVPFLSESQYKDANNTIGAIEVPYADNGGAEIRIKCNPSWKIGGIKLYNNNYICSKDSLFIYSRNEMSKAEMPLIDRTHITDESGKLHLCLFKELNITAGQMSIMGATENGIIINPRLMKRLMYYEMIINKPAT